MNVLAVIVAIVLSVLIAGLAAIKKRRPDQQPDTIGRTATAFLFIPIIWIAVAVVIAIG